MPSVFFNRTAVTIFTDAIFTAPVNAPVEVEVEWNTDRHDPGMYKIIVQAFDAVTNGLLSERDVQIEILTTKKIGGSGQFNPPLIQLAARKPVNITANISNKGNLPIEATTITANVTLKNEGYKFKNNLVDISIFIKDQGLNSPQGMDVDSLGNIYVANFYANTVSKILPDGTVTEFASGFSRPVDVDIRNNGDIYVLNQSSTFVRIAVNGNRSEVSTGVSLQRGFEVLDDGRVLVAVTQSLYEVTPDGTVNKLISGGLAQPKGMVTDSQGVIFIANNAENSITKYTNGVLSTFVADINQPYGITIDLQNNLYVTSYGDNSLVKVLPDGSQSVIATGLSGPYDVKISPEGSFIVSNQISSNIVSITPQGVVTTLIPSSIHSPKSIAYDTVGDLLVVNKNRNNIVKFSSSTDISIVASGINAVDIIPEGNGNIAVLETNTIKYVDSTGNITTFATGISASKDFVKASDGDGFLVAESVSNITRVDSSGKLSNFMSRQINEPRAMRSVNNEMYVASRNGVIKLDESGAYSHIASGLRNIYGLAIDANNNIYVSEFYDKNILKIDATGNITVFATTTFTPGALAFTLQGELLVAPWGGKDIYTVDALGETIYTSFNYPVNYDMLTDNAGNLWVTHLNSRRVSKLSADGIVTSYTLSRLRPTSLKSDENGGVYIGSLNGLEHVDANGNLLEVFGPNIIKSKTIFGINLDSTGRYWILDSNSRLTRFNSDLTVDVEFISLFAPKGMDYALNGDLIVVNNGNVIKISNQNQLPELIASGSYNNIYI